MSGIAGCFHLDGAPADRGLLESAMRWVAHRGPDGIHSWIDGPVALGHLMLRTTPESLQETQPLSSEDGALCLTLDGRVDNRRELRSALDAAGFVLRADTDAELVLRAYQCWGDDCPRHIVGDFAFAIWDKRDRKLFCARDLAGIRPFFYAWTGAVFAFASELRPLLDTATLRRKVNLGMLGEYLSGSIASAEETLHENVFRLPPAHRLVLKGGVLRVTRYIDIDPGRLIRYKTDAEYAEHFFDILREAVRCRLRAQTPVSLFLSGGLDSTSILGVAQGLFDEGLADNGPLAAYHAAYSHPNADERRYLEPIAGMGGGRIHMGSVDDATEYPLAEQIRRYQGFPDFPNVSMWHPLCSVARRSGSRVSLWGYGGDEWLSGNPRHCADLLRQLRIPAFVRQLKCDLSVARQWGAGGFGLGYALWNWCLSPLIPRSLRRSVRRFVPREAPPWISPGFARSIGLMDRYRQRVAVPRFPTEPQRAIYGMLVSADIANQFELLNRFEANHGLEGRYPFYDRRLIEFALAIPEEQRWRGEQTKYVLRQAMRGRIPEVIRGRISKADFTHLFVDALSRERAGEAFKRLRLVGGYVDAAAVGTMYARCVAGDVYSASPSWWVLASERWMESL